MPTIAGVTTEDAHVKADAVKAVPLDETDREIIEALRAVQQPATLTFIPDHGESLEGLGDGDGGHGGPVYNDAQFQIPAFVWVNDAYRAAHPARLAALTAESQRRLDEALESAAVPRLFVIEAEYALAMLRAEEGWVLALAEEITSGRLAWPGPRPLPLPRPRLWWPRAPRAATRAARSRGRCAPRSCRTFGA